jgi:hypothetical protein
MPYLGHVFNPVASHEPERPGESLRDMWGAVEYDSTHSFSGIDYRTSL